MISNNNKYIVKLYTAKLNTSIIPEDNTKIMKYKCDPCKYETNKKVNYDKHINSAKHTKYIVLPCKYCNTIYAKKGNLEKDVLNVIIMKMN